LALVPVLWIVGMTSMPSMKAVIAAKTADTVGVWIFTWSLIWIGSAAALGIAWAGWSWEREVARAARRDPAP
jgi:hypothetical protein